MRRCRTFWKNAREHSPGGQAPSDSVDQLTIARLGLRSAVALLNPSPKHGHVASPGTARCGLVASFSSAHPRGACRLRRF
jgi:hypothetical protein